MKLIIAGASGLVATEIIRQSLRSRDITTVLALARKPVAAPEGTTAADATKLKSVIIDDYETYPDHVKREFSGADACIWTVAITPTKSKTYAFEDVKRICQTSTLAGFRAMADAGPARPFRFLYMSGSAAERDQTKRPIVLAEYLLMRGETENQVLEFAASQQPPGSVQASVAKPGLITGHETVFRSVWGTALRYIGVIPHVSIEELVAAMLHQVKNGFEKDALYGGDLQRIGVQALRETAKES
ncbi:hypothetical protein B0H67DRAFT_647638 [Lasiosphaeris hirsuta]|uniref:NAD(P)-binding domain-containing protein n=1 Tax=Lasiosphaeris hirsuta TaxID=260670 RepID=A0AA40A197_9PEZI|nr:hypothetical protein B0H67DRAFT_647638 [Lasiosphaeris hirsuta]